MKEPSLLFSEKGSRGTPAARPETSAQSDRIRVSKRSFLQQITLVTGVALGGLFGGTLSSGCSSTQHHAPTPPTQTVKVPKKAAPKKTSPPDDDHIRLTPHHAITTRNPFRARDLIWDEEERDFIGDENPGVMNISLSPEDTIDFGMHRRSTWHHYERAIDEADYTRLTDYRGDIAMLLEPRFPVTLNYRVSLDNKRSAHLLANYDFINSTRLSLDNILAATLYGIGERQQWNDKLAYRSTAFAIQLAGMLINSRFGHEFAHGFDDTVRTRRQLPLEGLLFAYADSTEEISYQDLIGSQAAGLNNSSIMALHYWRQAEVRGNLVAALGFFLSRNDALMQWLYGHAFHDGHPEALHRRRIQRAESAHGITLDPGKSTDELEEDFEQGKTTPQETLDPSVYQVTGNGDNVAYIKLLEILGHGNAHRDKDLGIILGTNAMTAYFWQSLYEMIQYLANGKQTHERWRLAGPIEWPVFSTFRLPSGYLTQGRLPLVFPHPVLNRLTLIGGHDLDRVLGGLNTVQIGAEMSGQLPGVLQDFRWQIGTTLSFDRDDWSYQGNVVETALSYNLGSKGYVKDFSLFAKGAHHHNDPLMQHVRLEDNGFSLRLGVRFALGKYLKPYKTPQAPRPPRGSVLASR